MAKQNFIRKFASDGEYNDFKASSAFTRPNVSGVSNESDKKLYYNSLYAVTGVTLDQATATTTVGTDVTLTATVAPENAINKKVTWSVDDETIGTVADGVFSPLAAGNAVVTVTTDDGGYTATCNITVNEE